MKQKAEEWTRRKEGNTSGECSEKKNNPSEIIKTDIYIKQLDK